MKISFDIEFKDVDDLFEFVDWCKDHWGQTTYIINDYRAAGAVASGVGSLAPVLIVSDSDYSDYRNSAKLWAIEAILGKGFSYRIWIEEVIELTEFKLRWL